MRWHTDTIADVEYATKKIINTCHKGKNIQNKHICKRKVCELSGVAGCVVKHLA